MKRRECDGFLSINYETIPTDIKAIGQRIYRSITVDGEEIEFSGGFYRAAYKKVMSKFLQERVFGLEDARQSIEIVHEIRTAEISDFEEGEKHEFTSLPLTAHPFGLEMRF